jgi:hypothetical protein
MPLLSVAYPNVPRGKNGRPRNDFLFDTDVDASPSPVVREAPFESPDAREVEWDAAAAIDRDRPQRETWRDASGDMRFGSVRRQWRAETRNEIQQLTYGVRKRETLQRVLTRTSVTREVASIMAFYETLPLRLESLATPGDIGELLQEILYRTNRVQSVLQSATTDADALLVMRRERPPGVTERWKRICEYKYLRVH